jgi:hypothetical protein
MNRTSEMICTSFLTFVRTSGDPLGPADQVRCE